MAEHTEAIRKIYKLTRRFRGFESQTFSSLGEVYAKKNFVKEKCLQKNRRNHFTFGDNWV